MSSIDLPSTRTRGTADLALSYHRQLEHQIAAETLLSILPRSNRSDRSGPSASPEKPSPKESASREPEINGSLKRKATEVEQDADSPALKRPAASRSLFGNSISPRFGATDTLAAREEERRRELERERERDRERERAIERSRIMEERARSPMSSSLFPSANKSGTALSTSASAASKSALPSTDSGVGRPPSRDNPLGTAYSRLPSRYGSLFNSIDSSDPAYRAGSGGAGTQRDTQHGSSQSASTAAASRTAAPSWASSTHPFAFSQNAISRKELLDHKEQLLEGKKWLEATLLRTEKLLSAVNDRLADTGANPASPATSRANPSLGASSGLGSKTSTPSTMSAQPKDKLSDPASSTDIDGPRTSNGIPKDAPVKDTTLNASSRSNSSSPWNSHMRSGYGAGGSYLFGLGGYSSSPYRSSALELHREAREKELREARERERLRDMKEREAQAAANKNSASTASSTSSSTATGKSAEPTRLYRGFWPVNH
jgi:hypothetical protein